MSEQIVLICVGLVGSGKSTFAEALERYFPNYVRCNQDDLGDRRSVEDLARSTLRAGRSVCIDRTNFDAQQRAHWINIAHQRPGTSVWVLVFNTPKSVCAERLKLRTMHPTIHSPEEGLRVLENFSSNFRQPTQTEGYDRLVSLSVAEQSLDYTRDEVSNILQRLRDAPAATTPTYFRGRGRGNNYTPRGGRYNSTQNSYSSYSSRGSRGTQNATQRQPWRGWGASSNTPPQQPGPAACGDRADIYVPPEELERQSRALAGINNDNRKSENSDDPPSRVSDSSVSMPGRHPIVTEVEAPQIGSIASGNGSREDPIEL